MVAALKKLTGGDLSGRFSAWWNGKDYKPAPDSEPAKPAESPKPKPSLKSVAPSEGSKPGATASSTRIAALEALWGEGKFSPGGSELYNRITEILPEIATDESAQFGVLNSDPAWTSHLMGALGCSAVIGEWRQPVLKRFREAFPDFDAVNGDLDRPAFEPGSLKLLFSQDAFAFADHKSGLAVRALRSLAPGGYWIVLDTVRGTAKGDLAPAFASAWAEPQLPINDEIVEMCEAAGFTQSRDEEDVSGDLVQACRYSLDRFGDELEDRLSGPLKLVNKAVFMNELAWEAESWKWRQRAYAGDLIHCKMWRFRKPEA
ncbi:MAG: hypothetical protein CMK07_15175 [Ponticaulis sp.]|nr:hypothetical protein [Ponticaulis sp.]